MSSCDDHVLPASLHELLEPDETALGSEEWSGLSEHCWNGNVDLAFDTKCREWISLEQEFLDAAKKRYRGLFQGSLFRAPEKILSTVFLSRRQFCNLERCESCQCQKLKFCRDVILTECFQLAWFADSNPKSELAHIQNQKQDGAHGDQDLDTEHVHVYAPKP